MSTWHGQSLTAAAVLLSLQIGGTALAAEDEAQRPADGAVSYYEQVRPIFQARCQGCHQPSKAGGTYVMTAFDRLLSGGESEIAAVVPGDPDASYLVEQVTPDADGFAFMPQKGDPLHSDEVELIRRWIAEGAVDDTPSNARARYSRENPPVYSRPPVITSIDYSPDGSKIAVAGFNEVLLLNADGSELLARLIGLSERIESVKFSPDGASLAVTGGLPGRMGEVQIWDVEKQALRLSVPITYDTIYGASWSPDGSTIAFGCGDNSVRAIDAGTGEQVLFLGAHEDWALDTVFSKDGSHLISVGRDRAVKLTEVATERFVDNVTSITPGALKGGVQAVARHPERDEIVVGGADGVPKLYRVFRETKRVIGDDANLIREFPGLRGRIFAVAVSDDGTRIAAASSLDGTGEVAVYNYDFDTSLPDEIKQINEKVVTSRSAEENQKLDAYHKEGVREISRLRVDDASLYALTFLPDGRLAVAGGDGLVRLIDSEKGEVVGRFSPAPLAEGSAEVASAIAPVEAPPVEADDTTSAASEADGLPEGAVLERLAVVPAEIRLGTPFDYVQLVVVGTLADGGTLDLTRTVDVTLSDAIATVTRSGFVTPKADGRATLTVRLDGKTAEVPVIVENLATPFASDFVHDVNPVLSRLGCNAGTCHGAQAGKNGFKLSLRGYDPIFDVRALTDDHASRRVNVASPDDSLMLLKSTGAVPHVGGQLMKPGEPNYRIIRGWIAEGATLDRSTPRVTGIAVEPQKPVIQAIGGRQQMRVVATYADGTSRDVTQEAFVESGNTEVAAAGGRGLVTSIRRGEAPVLARFEGAYAATTLTVMGDRSGFAWEEPEKNNQVDELVARKWERMKVLPSGLCTDAEFIRRVTLDLTGLPPSVEEVRAFLDDPRDSKAKRDELVDRLIGSDPYVEYWTNKWADLLQVNSKFLGGEGAKAFRDWIRTQVAENRPYDEFAHAVLTASGSNRENPAASYYKILRTPAETMENTTHLFLGVRFNCNKCHDHPFERWTQDQYYETAAFFARVDLKPDPESGNRRIGGTAVEGAKPLYEIVVDADQGEVTHERTGAVTEPEFPFECEHEADPEATRREQLASWITSTDNPYFARSYVNRLWGYLLGVGLIEPLDDIRAGNPPTNPELLDYLTDQFISSGFDARHVMGLICKSRTYQLSVATNEWNADDAINYAHAVPKRLPAEVLFDAVHRVTGSTPSIPGVPAGTRAAALPDSGIDVASGFLTTFGRPARESACECERSDDLQLGPVMALVSGPTVSEAIADPKNALATLSRIKESDEALVDDLYLRILNREPTEAEVAACLDAFGAVAADHEALADELGRLEAEFARKRPELERAREAAIVSAETELKTYEQEIAPKVAEAEKAKAEETARLQKELDDYLATLPAKAAEWAKEQPIEVRWAPLNASKLEGAGKAEPSQRPDGSIVVAGENGNGIVTVVAETDLANITGVRLEVLPDDSLPNKGPGRAPDGNFVLTELEVLAAPKADPSKAAPVKLVTPTADFNQQNFEIAKAVDGDTNNQGAGWAISPALGVVHWATFEAEQPIAAEGGTVLTFKLHQRFNGNKHTIGRFRLSVTTLPKPVGLGLAEPLREIVAVAPDLRTPAQREALLAYRKAVDPEVHTRIAALNASKQPLPEDPKLVELRAALEEAKLPVPVDPRLARLRKDVEMSVTQVAEGRLTAAQDIAWALINSPAFLFNH